MPNSDCCILNQGDGAWAFEPLAKQLASALQVEIAEAPRQFNYVLHAEPAVLAACGRSFIPLASIATASDKRALAEVFLRHQVPTPRTHLADTLADAQHIRAAHPGSEWCLKYPLGCGGSGHRMLAEDVKIPDDWPRPFVVQEFIRMDAPEVLRTYAAGGRMFGWIARRFPPGRSPSPWVAHARGARYERAGDAPAAALAAARQALQAAGLLASFGCADLLRSPTGEWVVLEVGTDGLHNHVDRDLGDPDLEQEIANHVAEAFHSWVRVQERSSNGSTKNS
jgi:hypothetical protein